MHVNECIDTILAKDLTNPRHLLLLCSIAHFYLPTKWLKLNAYMFCSNPRKHVAGGYPIILEWQLRNWKLCWLVLQEWRVTSPLLRMCHKTTAQICSVSSPSLCSRSSVILWVCYVNSQLHILGAALFKSVLLLGHQNSSCIIKNLVPFAKVLSHIFLGCKLYARGGSQLPKHLPHSFATGVCDRLPVI